MTQHTAFQWTEERFERAKQLWKEGRSGGEISAELGCTRNAVLGKLTRAGIGQGNKPDKPVSSRAKRSVAGARADNAIIFRMRAERKRKPLKKPRKLIPDEQRKDLIGILDLTHSTCRWPIGDRPVMYCGHEVEEGKSYCPHHHAIAYRKPVKQDISDELRDKRRAGMLKWWASQRGGKAA